MHKQEKDVDESFNKILKSQISGGSNPNDLADFSRAFNAALLNSNFVETLQNQIE